jgi:hypothetical protein
MSDLYCPDEQCEYLFELEWESFDGTGYCPGCKTHWEVEWDYVGDDYDIAVWVTGKKSDG